MRTNIYSQELTSEVKLVEKPSPEGSVFSAVMFMLHSSNMLHQPPDNTGDEDDRSAVTFWLPESAVRREALAQTLERAANLVREAKLETGELPVSLEPGPSIVDTHQAKKDYVEGMKRNYPGLDPRISLLGLKENSYEYITEAYGYKLVKVSKPIDAVVEFLFQLAIAVGVVTVLSHIYDFVFK